MAQRKLQNSKEAAIGSKDLRDGIALYLGEGPIRKNSMLCGWLAGKNPKISQGLKKITEDKQETKQVLYNRSKIWQMDAKR